MDDFLRSGADDLVSQILQFWEAGKKNQWVTNDVGAIYVRRAWRPQIQKEDMLDIASVEIDSSYRGYGVFTRILGRLEKKGIPLFIENVLDSRFRDFFRKRNYQEYTNNYDVCFFRPRH